MTPSPHRPRRPPRPWVPRLLAAHGVLVYAFLYLPILVLVVLSFNAGQQVSLWRGFSLRWYAALLDTEHESRARPP